MYVCCIIRVAVLETRNRVLCWCECMKAAYGLPDQCQVSTVLLIFFFLYCLTVCLIVLYCSRFSHFKEHFVKIPFN